MTTRKTKDFETLHYCADLRSPFLRGICGRFLQSQQIGRNLVFDAVGAPELCTCIECRALLEAPAFYWRCDHCGKPERFNVLCADCEALVCQDCGRVLCLCSPRAPSLRVRRAAESMLTARERLIVAVAAAFEALS